MPCFLHHCSYACQKRSSLGFTSNPCGGILDPDKLVLSRRKPSPLIRVFHHSWCIFSKVQLHPWMACAYTCLTLQAWARYIPLVCATTDCLFQFQSRFYPHSLQGWIPSFVACLHKVGHIFLIIGFCSIDSLLLLSRVLLVILLWLGRFVSTQLIWFFQQQDCALVCQWCLQRFLPVDCVQCFLSQLY